MDAFDQEDAAMKAARQDGLGAAIPLADGDLSPAPLNALADILREAIPALTNNEITPESIALGEVTEPVPQMPADIGSQVMAIAGMVDAYSSKIQGLDRYKFDPLALMTSDTGVQEMANTIASMAADKKVVAAMQAPLPEGGDEEAGELPDDERTAETDFATEVS